MRAPITGLIGAKQVSIGELVGKGEPTLLATMSTLDPIWFYCNVSEVEYLQAESQEPATPARKLGELPLTLILADGTEHPDQGKFVFIDRAVDVKTGTLRVRAEFPNPDEAAAARACSRGSGWTSARARTASWCRSGRSSNCRARTSSGWSARTTRPRQRPVKVGEQVGSSVLIIEGLKAGERIVVEGVQKVREGAPVQRR